MHQVRSVLTWWMKLLHVFVVGSLILGSLTLPASALAAAAPATDAAAPATPAPPTAQDVARAEARFQQALNRLLALPDDAPEIVADLTQQQLVEANATYQRLKNEFTLAQAMAMNIASGQTRAPPAGDKYRFESTTGGVATDQQGWLMQGTPAGDNAAFDATFNEMLESSSVASPDAPTVVNEGPTAPIDMAEPAASDAPAPGESVFPPYVSNPVQRVDAKAGGLAAGLNRPLRACANLTVTITRIQILDDSDPGSQGEWRLELYVNDQRKDWNNDANDGGNYTINQSWDVPISSDGAQFKVSTGGWELDSPGFPLYDNNDRLSYFEVFYGSGDNWLIGEERKIEARGEDGTYDLYVRADCLPPYLVDLRSAISGSSSVVAGNTINYTAYAINDGPGAAGNVQMTISLPGGLSNINASASQGSGCSTSGSTLYCSMGDMGSSSSASVSISAITPYQIGTFGASTKEPSLICRSALRSSAATLKAPPTTRPPRLCPPQTWRTCSSRSPISRWQASVSTASTCSRAARSGAPTNSKSAPKGSSRRWRSTCSSTPARSTAARSKRSASMSVV